MEGGQSSCFPLGAWSMRWLFLVLCLPDHQCPSKQAGAGFRFQKELGIGASDNHGEQGFCCEQWPSAILKPF